MRQIRKAPLAIAVAATLGASSAQALMLDYVDWANTDAARDGVNTPVYAAEVFRTDDDAAYLAEDLVLFVEDTDEVITQQLTLRVLFTLEGDGQTFVMPTGTDCTHLLVHRPTDATDGAITAAWGCTIAGGGDGSNTVTFSVSGGTDPEGVRAGPLIRIPPGDNPLANVAVDGLAAEAAAGQGATLGASISVSGLGVLDSTSGFEMGLTDTGVVYDSDPSASDNTLARIDVGADPARSVFAYDGVVGSTDTGNVFDAGDVWYEPNWYAVSAGWTDSNLRCVGTGAAADPGQCPWGLSSFMLDSSAAGLTQTPGGVVDVVTITVTGSDFSAFTDDTFDPATDSIDDALGAIWLIPDGYNCTAPESSMPTSSWSPDMIMDVNPAGTATATFNVMNNRGDDFIVCMRANGNPIEAQSLSANVDYYSSGTTLDPASSGSMPLLPLQYNGSIVDLFMINPGSNTLAQGFMRFCNEGPQDGTVVLNGWDDAGTEAPGEVSFDLGSGACLQINAQDLEGGNATKGLTGSLGDGSGKWRVLATGQFDGLQAGAYIRNTESGDVYNVSTPSLNRSTPPDWVFHPALLDVYD